MRRSGRECESRLCRRAELRQQFPTTPILFGGAGGYVPTVNDHPQAEGPYGSTAEVWATATLTLAAGAKNMEVSA